jgi:uncharacterized cupin superfamily protein
MLSLKIVSGGQTGIDRGALDAALEAGSPCGGWCPANRGAEDGTIDKRYPLTPLPSGGYPERTRKNVSDSDGTLIIHFGELEGGTALTAKYCGKIGKPCLIIDAPGMSPADAAEKAAGFVRAQGIAILNVAGPRASREPAAHGYAQKVVRLLLEAVSRAGQVPAGIREEEMITVNHNPTENELKALGVTDWPIWSKEVSRFDWTYDAEETCYVLEGDVTVTPEGGEPVTIGRGDLVTFPKGMRCVWDISAPIRKHYRFD